MIVKPHYFYVMLVATTLAISACGGSSSDNDNTSPVAAPIIVNAGSNITLNESETNNLIGGSSGGQGSITYLWLADSAVQIIHDDTSIASATLTAPIVTQVTEYAITLQATDTVGTQQSDTITLTVNPINELPIANVQVLQIDGYNENEFPVNTQIILDGSGSSDSDPQTSDAAIMQYMWQQIAGPQLLLNLDISQSVITLLSPLSNEPQMATIRLTVTDQEYATSSTDYSFTLLSEQQTHVQVSANAIRSVFSGELVVLHAEATSLSANAAPFTAQWTQNSTAIINDASAFTTVAISPLVSEDQTLTYTITASDSFRNSESTQIEAQVYAPITRVINDTGVIGFASESGTNSNYQIDYPGQDASYGADRQTASGHLLKVGEGAQGFDFTRLDNNGDAVENPSFSFSCVRDNVTALVWQIKEEQDTNSINYAEQQFTWYVEEDNGNFAGEENLLSSSCNVQTQSCNTQAYIDEVNTQGLCGFYDWRLPSPVELQSIIHYGKSSPPMVDSIFFPYLGSVVDQTLWYWTNQTSADGVNDDTAYNAWAYDFQTGNDGFLNKASEQRVVLVRAGR